MSKMYDSSKLLVVLSIFMIFYHGVNGEEKNCYCGAFMNNPPNAPPFIVRNPNVQMPCTAEGREDCKKLCAAMGQVGKEKAAETVCDAVKGNLTDAKPSMFSKICDDTTWEYAGLTATIPICCVDGKPSECAVKP